MFFVVFLLPVLALGEEETAPLPPPSSCNFTSPSNFSAVFITDIGNYSVFVNKSWAPSASDRFYSLVKCGYYNVSEYFRVVPGLLAQWGLSGYPLVDQEWGAEPIDVDPVVQSNIYGMVSFAVNENNASATQVFVNYGDNSHIYDTQGIAPFGKISNNDMKQVVEQLYNGYGEQPNQDQIIKYGNTYLQKEFPLLDSNNGTLLL